MTDDEFDALCSANSFGAVARGEFPLLPRQMLKALLEAAVAAERERWIGGVKVSIPTDTMEQEIAAHTRRAVAAERERCAKLCDPSNADRPDDWTEYAKTRAECAARIRGA